MKSHVLKALIYRVLAFISEEIVLFLLTGSWYQATKFAIILAILQTILYYIWEEGWDRGIKRRLTGEE